MFWIRVSFVIYLLLGPCGKMEGLERVSLSFLSRIHTIKYHGKLFNALYNETNLVSQHVMLNNSCKVGANPVSPKPVAFL